MAWTPIADLTGPNVELRKSPTHLQWRVAESGSEWADLIPLADLRGLPGANSAPTDTAFAGLISTVGVTETKVALRDFLSLDYGKALNLEEFPGVDPTGAAECAGAIQAAVDAASAAGVPLVSGPHQYTIATGIELEDDADLSRAVFNYTGTGIAITVGNSISPAVDPDNAGISRKKIRTPYVIASAKTETGWDQIAGSVGVRVANTNDCEVHIGAVRNFETGVQFRGAGAGGGVTYCRFFLSALVNNKRNIQITSDGVSGYSNQCQVFGGTLNFDAAEGEAVVGTRHILIDSIPSAVDGWTFLQPSLEDSGGVCEFTIDCAGNNNVFDQVRFETAVGFTPSVVWRDGSHDNEIRGGVHVDRVVENIVGVTANRIMRHTGVKLVAGNRALDSTDEGKTIVVNAANPVTLTLPNVAHRSPGTRVTIKNVAASTLTVNTSNDPLDGGFTASIPQWGSKTFMSQQSPDARWVTV